MLESCDCFFKKDFEQEKNVRHLWYIFCYHFLPLINKKWKACLEGSRLLKPTFLYEHITISDQAMVLWFIKIWEPKMKEQSENGWPVLDKPTGEGEQELKAGLKEYIRLYNLVAVFASKEEGDLACRWSEMFWEEMMANHPKIYKKRNNQTEDDMIDTEQEGGKEEEAVVLPGMDVNNNHLLGCFGKRKWLKRSNTQGDTSAVNNAAITNQRITFLDSSNDLSSSNQEWHNREQHNNVNLDFPNNPSNMSASDPPFPMEEVKDPTDV